MTRDYQAPELEVLGTIAEVTRAATNGTATDADFPQGTPFNNITFS